MLAAEEFGLDPEGVGVLADGLRREGLSAAEGCDLVLDLVRRWRGLGRALDALDREEEDARRRAESARADALREGEWLIEFRRAVERVRGNPELRRFVDAADAALGARIVEEIRARIEREREAG